MIQIMIIVVRFMQYILLAIIKVKVLGKKLFEAGIQELKNMGFNKMIVGCLANNPSNDFYKHMGGKLIKTRIFEKLQLPENVYYFDEI